MTAIVGSKFVIVSNVCMYYLSFGFVYVWLADTIIYY